MIDSATKILFEYGALGAMVVIMGYTMYRMRRDHRKDRDEWMKKIWEQNDKLIDSQNAITEEITALRVLLENSK